MKVCSVRDQVHHAPTHPTMAQDIIRLRAVGPHESYDCFMPHIVEHLERHTAFEAEGLFTVSNHL